VGLGADTLYNSLISLELAPSWGAGPHFFGEQVMLPGKLIVVSSASFLLRRSRLSRDRSDR
jgi:hypothetical protein